LGTYTGNMIEILAQLTSMQDQVKINLIVPNGCDTQIVKNALVDLMKQVCLLEDNAKSQQESVVKVEEIPLESKGS